MFRTIRRGARAAAALVALILLTVYGGVVSRDAERRRASGVRPRLVYGPVPILSFKYMSRAMRSVGYEATTVVHELYRIHASDDFDLLASELNGRIVGPPGLARILRWLGPDYAVFSWAVARFDVFHCFFDGGFLRNTPLRYLEAQLLHRAGKRLIVMPYGGDVAIPSAIRSMLWRDGLMRNYPHLARTEAETRRRIGYFTRHADFIVACVVHAETIPRWDLLTTLYYPIDTEEWTPVPSEPGNDGLDGPVVIVHAPNHRGMKGTEFLVEACRTLRDEGFDVELRLLEGIPNVEVRNAMARADIVAEQFLLGFALTALEGMSLARPVLSNLSEPGYYEIHRLMTGLDACPIVSVQPGEIVDRLRELVTDPARRRVLGAAGRRYVEEYHSYPAMAHLWDAIYRRVWSGEDIDPRSQLPGQLRRSGPPAG